MANFKKVLLDLVGDRILKPARVHSVEVISEHYRVIHLEAALLQKINFRPGEKVQINTGDWNVRTYTPVALNTATGRLSILAFLPGKGPGSQWAKNAKAGDDCQILGPRSSVVVSDPESILLFGDETSLGLAAAFKEHYGDAADARFVFEVSSVVEAQLVASHFGFLQNSTFIVKQIDHSHWERTFKKLLLSIDALPEPALILSGNAKAVQFLRKRFRETKTVTLALKSKAYWAEGKIGLD